MPRPRSSTLLVGLLLGTGLVFGAGCVFRPESLATFGAGYLLGRLSGNPAVVTTVERVCYQAGERVPCP
jgi:hypothetical protein